MATLLSGLIGGSLATIVMTVFMTALGDDSSPPTAVLWSKFVGDEPPEEYVMPGMALHILYGVGAGVAFVVFASALGYGPGSLTTGLAAGLVYAVALGSSGWSSG